MAIVDKNIDKEPKWYVLHVFSGYENIAKQNLEITIEKYALQDRIFQIVIPMEDELVEKRGKKVLVPKKTMPGYMLVKMMYGDDIWHAVTRTQYITGFVGPKGRPICITDEEARLRTERQLTIGGVSTVWNTAKSIARIRRELRSRCYKKQFAAAYPKCLKTVRRYILSFKAISLMRCRAIVRRLIFV